MHQLRRSLLIAPQMPAPIQGHREPLIAPLTLVRPHVSQSRAPRKVPLRPRFSSEAPTRLIHRRRPHRSASKPSRSRRRWGSSVPGSTSQKPQPVVPISGKRRMDREYRFPELRIKTYVVTFQKRFGGALVPQPNAPSGPGLRGQTSQRR